MKKLFLNIGLIVVAAFAMVFAWVKELEARRQQALAFEAMKQALSIQESFEARNIEMLRELSEAQTKIKELEARCK